MAEGEEGGVAAGGAGAELAGGGGDGSSVGAPPAWMATLPEDLRADPTLSRYPDVEKLARAQLDLRKLTASRVIVPGETADDATWNGFFSAIGRPDAPDKYDVPVPEGADGTFADAFRPEAFKLGLTGKQVKGLAEFNNAQVKAREDAYHAQATAEVEAVKAELKQDYPVKIAKAADLWKQLGGDPATADEFALKLGSGRLVKFMIGLADRAGELGRVDGLSPELRAAGGGDPDRALGDRQKDPSWRERAKLPGTPERGEYDQLVAAIAARRAQKPA